MRIENTHELNVSSNIFCWHRGSGMVLKDVSWGTVSSNEFIDAGVRTRDGSLSDGVVIEGGTRGVQLVGNALFNWGDQCPMGTGIVETADCSNNAIANNNLSYCAEGGIISQGKGTIVKDSVTELETAYQGMGRKGFPDFTRKRIEKFIRE